MHNRLLLGAWVLVCGWVAVTLLSYFIDRGAGTIISLAGLVASLFVVGAFYSRSRRG